jgi:hypothetical protein
MTVRQSFDDDFKDILNFNALHSTGWTIVKFRDTKKQIHTCPWLYLVLKECSHLVPLTVEQCYCYKPIILILFFISM